MKLCKNCATEINSNAHICPNCGNVITNEIKTDNNAKEDKYQEFNNSNNDTPYMNNPLVRGPFDKTIAIILCIFLGFLGIHKLYERKYYAFILYAFTFGLSGIGIIYDLFRLIKREKKYYVTSIPFM